MQNEFRASQAREAVLSLCAAFVPSREAPQMWTPCASPAAVGDRLCAMHRDAVDGALLGSLVVRARESRLRKWRKKQTMRRSNVSISESAKGSASRAEKS
jgi:hypothetical protein